MAKKRHRLPAEKVAQKARTEKNRLKPPKKKKVQKPEKRAIKLAKKAKYKANRKIYWDNKRVEATRFTKEKEIK